MSNNIPKLRFPGFTGEWEEKKLGNCLEERNEQFPEDDNYPLMAFVAWKGVSPKGERFDRSALVKDAANKKYKRTELGDFIYSSNNLESGSIGFNTFGSACISPVYSIFKPKNNSIPAFIGTLLTQKSFIAEMVKYRQGVVYGQWKIPESEFLKIKVFIPSLPEQQKIAGFLTEMDNHIAAQGEKVEALKEKKKGLMQQLFPQPGQNTPQLRFPGFTGEWEEKKLGEVVSVNRGVRVTRKDLTEKGIYPVFQNTNSPMGYYDLYNVSANNPFVIIGGSAGVMGFCRTNFWAADDCAYFGDSKLLDKYFLYSTLLLHEKDIKNNVRGGNIPRIDRNSIEKLKISLPSLPEQEKIAGFLTEMDNLIASESEKLESLKNHKKGLMQQLFPQPEK